MTGLGEVNLEQGRAGNQTHSLGRGGDSGPCGEGQLLGDKGEGCRGEWEMGAILTAHPQGDGSHP